MPKHKTLRILYFDKFTKIIVNRCDICNDRLDCVDNIEYQIDMLDEINNSYLDEYDRREARLLLCDYCQKEYAMPSYITN